MKSIPKIKVKRKSNQKVSESQKKVNLHRSDFFDGFAFFVVFFIVFFFRFLCFFWLFRVVDFCFSFLLCWTFSSFFFNYFDFSGTFWHCFDFDLFYFFELWSMFDFFWHVFSSTFFWLFNLTLFYFDFPIIWLFWFFLNQGFWPYQMKDVITQDNPRVNQVSHVFFAWNTRPTKPNNTTVHLSLSLSRSLLPSLPPSLCKNNGRTHCTLGPRFGNLISFPGMYNLLLLTKRWRGTWRCCLSLFAQFSSAPGEQWASLGATFLLLWNQGIPTRNWKEPCEGTSAMGHSSQQNWKKQQIGP